MKAKYKLGITYILLGCSLITMAQTKIPPIFKSSFVSISDSGSLVYTPDKQGNALPDFSRVGYHHSDLSLPDYPVTMSISPISGDNTQHIQNAIDRLTQLPLDANGHRGVLLLKRGTYQVANTIFIKSSGIVLKGEGCGNTETLLLGTSSTRYPIIKVTGEGLPREISGSRVSITDKFVPVGTFHLNVTNGSNFHSGDRVMVYRPGTIEWIQALRMDQIIERNGTKQWSPDQYNLAFERQIVKVEGNTLYIDNPIVMQMETKYGGGQVYKYSFADRVSEVGVTDLCIESVYQNYEDANHAWTGVMIDKAENCWVKNVTTRHIANSAVFCERYAKNITVLNCRCLEPKSVITGGYRYSFYNNGQQNLFMSCVTTEGRHDFVTGARVLGPNVFYRCQASQTYADIGPHHRWACGTLYDNIITDGAINVQDRGNMGSGHGWSGVTQVLWNCSVKTAVVQSPWTTGANYSIGTKGAIGKPALPGRPSGKWEGRQETNMQIRSLFEAQLMARKNLKLDLLNKEER